MTFTFGDVRRSLKKKGFVENTNKHHVYLHLYYKGKRTNVYTYCSHGASSDDVRHGVASSMKCQLGLDSRKQLEDLINCPMSAETYLMLLQEKKSIPK